MKTKRSAILSAAFLGALFTAAPLTGIAEDQHLLDPGFEDEIAVKEGGWNIFGPSRISGEYARQGDMSMLNGATSKSVPYPPYFIGSVSGSYQEFTARPRSKWRLTGYGLTPRKLVGTPSFGIVQISFFDDRGRDLGTAETTDENTPKAKLSDEINNQSPVGEWIELDTGIATAPEGTATVQAFTLYVDYSGSNIFQGVYFDDLILECIDVCPE